MFVVCIETHPEHLCECGASKWNVMERKNVTIEEEQHEWIKAHHINLSSLVREAIDNKRQEFAAPGDTTFADDEQDSD